MIDEMRTEHAEEQEETAIQNVISIPPRRLSEADYKRRLKEGQRFLAALPSALQRAGQSMILVFEGWDAAGKGGTIRRITDAIREDRCQVYATAAPTPEEAARHYLWRFWRTVPPVGSIAIYDRSWYGRVLVERVEGFTEPSAWERAYGEIRDFERTLTDGGYILRKFWLEISPEEQLRRFEARLRTPEKRHKLTGEDWRNRSHREAYISAIDDMIARTDTPAAPWEIIDAEDKREARLAVIDAVLHAAPSDPVVSRVSSAPDGFRGFSPNA